MRHAQTDRHIFFAAYSAQPGAAQPEACAPQPAR